MRQFCPKRSVTRSSTDVVVHRSSAVIVPFDVPTVLCKMPAQKISKMTEHQISTDKEYQQKQSKLHNNVLPEVLNEPIPIPSTSELTNGLKRQCSDELKDNDQTKKIRFTENGMEDKLEVTTLNNGKDKTALLLEKLDQLSESIEKSDEKKSNIFNKSNDINNKTNKSFNIINYNGNNGLGDEDLKEDSPSKENNSEDIGKDKGNNIINECENGNSKETTRNGENELVEEYVITENNITDLNRSSSLENLVIAENVDHEDVVVVVDDSPLENISPVVNDLTSTENNLNNSNTAISKVENLVNPKENDTQLLLENDVPSVKKNTNETQTQTIESHSDTNTTKANTEVNVSDKDNEDIDSDTDLSDFVNDIINGVIPITKESFPRLLKLFSAKESTFHQFDSYCTQKFIEVMTEGSYMGKNRSDLQLLHEREKFWRAKFSSLLKQFKELQSVVKILMEELKINKNAKPRLITRTVGLQAVLSEKPGGNMQLPKLMNFPPKPNDKPVNISDDDDDIAIVEIDAANQSSSTTVNRTTQKMQLPPQDIVTPTKNPAHPTTVDPDTIDLTGNDDIEESNIIHLEEPISSHNVVHHQSPGKLPSQQNGNFPNHNVTYIDVSNHPSTSSGFIVNASTSRSPQQATVLNRDAINIGDPKSKHLSPFIIGEVSRVDPVLVQPCTVTYTTQHVPVSHNISASLQATVPLTTGQLPVSLPQVSSGTSFTTCRLPISIRAIPTHTSVDQSLMVSQLPQPLIPPPPAIPIRAHPAKLPEIPNQRSLTSWKRLPPAPRVSLSRSLDRSNPHALVLSWSMTLSRTMAEINSYQIFAYHEISSVAPSVDLWRKIGCVNALALPMACSLSQFATGERYHFAVRAVDVYTRVGPFSLPQSVFLD